MYSTSFSELVLQWSRALYEGESRAAKKQLNFRQYIFKWEDRNQISDNQHIWKKFASLRELQKQWGTESRTKAEAAATVAGQLGEGEEAARKLETSGGKGRQPGRAGNGSPGLLGCTEPFLLHRFLRKM